MLGLSRAMSKSAIRADKAATRPQQHLYRRQRWRKLRLRQLQAQPLCAFCLERGTYTQASVADHKIAHRGNETLFWDEENLQSLCKPCHDSEKQRDERSTKARIGHDGWPVDHT